MTVGSDKSIAKSVSSFSPIVRSQFLLAIIAVVIIVLDQLSKLWVVNNLPTYIPVDLVPWLRPILSFTYAKNTGVAFGLFPQLGDFFTILNAVVIVGILFFQRSLPPELFVVHVALGLVTGGALGNLADRIFRGSVVDFIDVNFWPFRNWPVFNVADSSIVVGVIIMLILSIFFGELLEVPLDVNPADAES